MTDGGNLFLRFTERLRRAGIEYMVTGSVAGIVYGEPRLTHDVDLVVSIADSQAEVLAQAFPDEEFYCPPIEVIQLETRRAQRGHFNIIDHDTGFKADVYPIGRDPLHRWAFAQRRTIEIGDAQMSVAPPEYVILRKLEYFREGGSQKHLQDIRAMLRVSGEEIDRSLLDAKLAELGLVQQWEMVNARHDEI